MGDGNEQIRQGVRASGAIKSQALADFIREMDVNEQWDQKWLLYIDVSSKTEGSGVGIVLVIPEVDHLDYTVKFMFKASNNEAEYEALIRGMQLGQD